MHTHSLCQRRARRRRIRDSVDRLRALDERIHGRCSLVGGAGVPSGRRDGQSWQACIGALAPSGAEVWRSADRVVLLRYEGA